MDTSSLLHFRWYHLLVAAIFVATHLSAVTSLPWKSPPKWKLPPLPDRRTSSAGDAGDQEDTVIRADLLSRVRHLERVVQRRLDGIKLAKVRALEESIEQALTEQEEDREEAGRQGQHQQHSGAAAGGAAGVTEAEGLLEKELLQHEEPHKGGSAEVSSSHPAASTSNTQYNPMPKLKQISRDLVELIEEIDRHTPQ